MKKILLFLSVGVFALACSSRADTVALFTFESSLPAGTPGAGGWITNLAAEIGAGTASGLHSAASTYSNPAGNGSAHSFSSTAWNAGDFYQFAVSTVNYTNLTLSYDQTSSSTGPGQSILLYSLTGSGFLPVSGTNTVLQNGGSPFPAWNATTGTNVYSYSFSLSSLTSLENAPVVYFRLLDPSNVAANGGTVASGGTDRVDNFGVFGSPIVPVPEPGTVSLAAMAGAMLMYLNARRHKR